MSPAKITGAAAVCLSTVGPAHVAAEAADEWQFQAGLYGYFPRMSGSTVFPISGGGGGGISVDASDLLELRLHGNVPGSRRAVRSNLAYNMKSGKPIEDMNLNEPLLAVNFRW